MRYPEVELHPILLSLVYVVCLFPLIITCLEDSSSASLELNDDVLGLLVLKSDLNNPTALLSWNEEEASPCSWAFIRCDPTTGHVIELSLDNLGLSGKLGRGLQNLRHLKLLSLAQNNLTGGSDFNTTTTIAHLFPPNLQSLNLSHNRFSGEIPTAMIPPSIKLLDLSGNQFTGSLPEDLFSGSGLLIRSLSLSDNSLSGPIPSSLLSQCTSLNTLDLSRNRFSGNPFTFTSSILMTQQLSHLRVLNLASNEFSGPVPSGFFSGYSFIREIHLQDNQFSGPLPVDLGLCPHLSVLDLSRNQFERQLPPGPLSSSLTQLDLSSNKLTGELPHWLGNMMVMSTNLILLDLSSNGFTGTLPPLLGLSSSSGSLQHLVLSYNNISGPIPTSLVSSCPQLSILHLGHNSFTGPVPEGLFGMELKELDLSWNQLTGSVPSRISQSLVMLDLSGNKFEGDIPPEMGLFTNLAYLNLSWNPLLHSRIPPELGYLQKLSVLDLRASDLYGDIPPELCDTTTTGLLLTILQLDGNQLTGSIPQHIGNCSSLHLLTLSHNKLTGPIPSSVAMLDKLQILRLEVNQLAGEIPNSLGALPNLVALNVSYNRLVGRLPTSGVFPTLQPTSLQGNLGICSPRLTGPCIMHVPKPLVLDPNQSPHHDDDEDEEEPAAAADHHGTTTASFNHKKFLTLSAIIAICAAVFILSGVVLVSVLNARARRSSLPLNNHNKNAMLAAGGLDLELENSSSSSSTSSTSGILSPGKLILFESDQIMTQPHDFHLNKGNAIGSGLLGTVHKVDHGTNVNLAVKKLLSSSHNIDILHSSHRDVRILGRVRHPNLVSLRGYYWTPNLQLLVSDYIPNGNLHSKLHPPTTPQTPPLSWPARFKIMLGTAKALAHLHHSCHPPIVHSNLKPTNILLDHNNNPKLSDFGLTRIIRGITNVLAQTAPGYVAPEMACGSITDKCDVYAFGVMVLELVSGRKPLDYGEDSVLVLTNHVRVSLEEGTAMLDCVDHSMKASSSSSTYPEEEVVPVLKLALVCTSHIPSNRPSMPEVVQILQVIKTPIPTRRLEPY